MLLFISRFYSENMDYCKKIWILWTPLLIFLSFLLLVCSCCKKDGSTDSKTDNTDKYLGAWAFHYSSSNTKYGPINITWGDSYDFTGSINPGSSKNFITLVYSDANSLSLKVEPDGQILNTCGKGAPAHWSISCSGYFEGDSILYYNTSEQSPPNQVHLYTTELIGIRIGRNIQGKSPTATTTSATGVTT
jgi:hypothetical protein